jgi:hypothetical protein
MNETRQRWGDNPASGREWNGTLSRPSRFLSRCDLAISPLEMRVTMFSVVGTNSTLRPAALELDDPGPRWKPKSIVLQGSLTDIYIHKWIADDRLTGLCATHEIGAVQIKLN